MESDSDEQKDDFRLFGPLRERRGGDNRGSVGRGQRQAHDGNVDTSSMSGCTAEEEEDGGTQSAIPSLLDPGDERSCYARIGNMLGNGGTGQQGHQNEGWRAR